MRVVEPKQFSNAKKRRKFPVAKVFVSVLLIAALGVGGWFGYGKLQKKQPIAPVNAANTKVAEVAAPSEVKSATVPKTLREFSPDEFRNLYQSFHYPNIQEITDPPAITGNPEADEHIRKLAEARGYRMTKIPVNAIVKIDEPRLGDDSLLQPLAARSWNDLKAAAQKDGIILSITSGFRSPEMQRELFMERLKANGAVIEQIPSGQSDAAINQTLSMTAVPGYSRHHTGYTIDLWCEDGSGQFASSSCYDWLKANNYQRAKQHGWIPSYPEGTDQQGPEPEAWEYVWIGTDTLYE